MVRLRTWMRDAMTGGLTADGWEPVPFSLGMRKRGGLIDPAAFQKMAASKTTGARWTSGVAVITTPDKGDYVGLIPTEVLALEPSRFSALARATNDERDNVPWVFIWSDAQKPIADPIFGLWKTYKDVRDGLASVELIEPLESSIGAVLANGCHCKHPPARRTLVVLIGLWRPVPLATNIFGLSNDPRARSLEIKVYTLETTVTGNLLADDTKVRAVVADPLPSSELFRWTTDSPILGPAGLIGYGALGSAITDHLLRSGVNDMGGIDPDTMLPHNLARHHGGFQDLYRPKIEHFKRSAHALVGEGRKPQVRGFDENVLTLPDADLAERLQEARLIIDATADERVRGRLTKFNAVDQRQILRVEIFHRGHLGIEFVTAASGNPSLFDLYYLLCCEALTDTDIEAWLYDEHVDLGAASDELLFGFGCSSRTTRLPNYVVAQHASAFMPTIIQGLTAEIPPGIGINHLDVRFRPSGWRWIEVPEFFNVQPSTAPGWTVRLHPAVMSFLTSQRAAALPSETGGYLYGGWDAALKQISLVTASPLPPGSTASGTALTLGPAGNTALEMRLARRTRGRVALCGTWHSHPGASAVMSGKDAATMRGFGAIDSDLGNSHSDGDRRC